MVLCYEFKHISGVLLLFVVLSFEYTCAFTFQHPGVFSSKLQLDYMREQVLSKSEPFFTAFTQAVSSNIGSLVYTPQGPPSSGVIDCGYFSKPDYGCSWDCFDGGAAYLQALLFIITNDTRYANNAVHLLNTYAQNLKGFNNSNAPVQAAWSGGKWTKAAELIRYSNAGWKEDDVAAYASMLTSVYLPLLYNGAPDNGNWELAMIDAMFGIAVFTDDEALFNHSVTFWLERVPSYFYYEPLDGPKPRPAPRGNAYWYGETVFNASVSGICQETCRDLGHTQLGIAGMINGAETAFIQGVDLYGIQGERIMTGLEFNANLLTGGKPLPYLCGNGTVHVSQYPTWETAYNNYHTRSGYSLPHTYQQIVTHVRPTENIEELPLISVFETLSHGGSPSRLPY